jgi:hypothetical protein
MHEHGSRLVNFAAPRIRDALAAIAMAVAVTVAGCAPSRSSTAPAAPASSLPISLTSSSLCQMVPKLDRLVVRRVDELAQNHFTFSFPAEVTVTATRRVQVAARALCALPKMPTGVICPADFGIVYHLSFFAGRRSFPDVTVRPAGCQQVGGLGVTRWVARSPQFWRAIGLAIGLAHPSSQTFRGSGPLGS